MLDADESFVSIMSHGCSGDIWRRDYTKSASWIVDPPPKEEQMQIDAYAQAASLDIEPFSTTDKIKLPSEDARSRHGRDGA